MATVIAVLAATAFTVGGTAVTYGGLLTAAALGATAYSSLNTPDIPGAARTDSIADKTTPQQADQLDAAQIGDDESEKRKRKSAKEKFKIQRDGTPEESGVSLDSSTQKPTGVQI